MLGDFLNLDLRLKTSNMAARLSEKLKMVRTGASKDHTHQELYPTGQNDIYADSFGMSAIFGEMADRYIPRRPLVRILTVFYETHSEQHE